MKSIFKVTLVVVLFSSIVLAEEGNMGSGGRTCPPQTTNCLVIETEPTNDKETTEPTSFFELIGNYLFSIFE